MSINYILSLNEIESLDIRNFIKNNSLEQVIILFYKESFDEALQEVSKAIKTKNFSKNEKFLLKLIEINIHNHNNQFSESLESIKNLMNHDLVQTYQIFSLILNILKTHARILDKTHNNNIEMDLKVLENSLADAKKNTLPEGVLGNILSMIQFLKGLYYRDILNFTQSISEIEKCIKIRNVCDEAEIDLPFFILGRLNGLIENYSLSVEYYHKSLKLYQNKHFNGILIDNNLRIFKIMNNMGFSYWNFGDFEKALECYNHALQLSESLGNQWKVVILTNIALIYWEMGEIRKSLDYNEKALFFAKKLDNKPYIVKIYNNLGNIYLNKGEKDPTLDYYIQSLAIAEDIGDKYETALVLNNLGETFQSIGDYQKAFEYYKKGLDIFTELNAKVEISVTFHNLVNISLILNNEKNVLKFLSELEQCKQSNKEENKIINSSYDLSLANVKKSSKRFTDIGEAQQIYLDLIKTKDTKHNYIVEAILQLCELYLLELKFSRKEGVLQELSDLINNLFEIAKEQNSFLLLCHSYMLLAKISILNFDSASIEKAKELLERSLLTAQEQGYNHLARKIAFEMENQTKIINKINSTDTSNLTLDFLLELTEIEDYVAKVIKNTITSLPLDVEDEEPKLLLLLARSGVPIFSYSFGNPENYDSLLIGGFLSAINSFFQQTFFTEEIIERISQKEFTILFRPHDEITFCYVFTGPYIKAVDRFEMFINELLLSEPLQETIKEALPIGKAINNDPIINEALNTHFRSIQKKTKVNEIKVN